MKTLVLVALIMLISGCISQETQLTPANPPTWAPTYIPSGWNLTSVQKSTDYEYVMNYMDSNGTKIELLLEDDTGTTKEDVCKILQISCENRNGVLIYETFDGTEKTYNQNAIADNYMVSYTSKNRIDTGELIKIVQSMK